MASVPACVTNGNLFRDEDDGISPSPLRDDGIFASHRVYLDAPSSLRVSGRNSIPTTHVKSAIAIGYHNP